MPTINGKACVVNGTPVDKVFSGGKQVYGKNLIVGSYDFSWGFYGNGDDATFQKITMDSGEVALHVITHDGGSGFWFHPDLPSGIYTTSFEVKGTGIVNKLGWEGLSDASMNPTSDWQRVSRTASLDSWYAFVFYGTMDVYVRLLKVEKGSVATPYSIAPEDVM